MTEETTGPGPGAHDDERRPVAVLGAGVIGAGWAARFLLHGHDVRVFDPSDAATARLDGVLDAARRSLPALADVAMPPEGTLRVAGSVAEAVSGAGWIQESAPERLDAKRALLAEIERHAPANAIVASSTSGFRPSELATGATHPGRVIVAHPFNPVYLLPLVELVGEGETLARAARTLESLGMHPLALRREIDAHLADRLLEAVWREALWLVRDDIATTAEIDDAIRMGFGLRWAQMGLFETYRVAGGDAGMRHFIAQFGPTLAWPWSRLTDVPELDDALIDKIAGQSDAQADGRSIVELERTRDDNLVALLRALKGRGYGAGTVLNRHDERLRALAHDGERWDDAPGNGGTDAIARTGDGADPAGAGRDGGGDGRGAGAVGSRAATEMPDAPFETIRRVVPIDWTDYNGHMNESRYGQLFSDAADGALALLGADAAYVERGFSWFTVDIRIRFLAETRAGETVVVRTQVLDAGGKKLRLFHHLHRGDGVELATGEQLLLHVSLETRRACPPEHPVDARLDALAAAQSNLPRPDGASDPDAPL